MCHLITITKLNDNDAKILLIDDEEDLLTVYKLFLSSAGYTNLKAFSDPREGLKHVVDLKDPSHYDLAILDIRMGDINGIQLYQILKIMRPNIKVLFVSAAGCSRRDNDVLSRAKTE